MHVFLLGWSSGRSLLLAVLLAGASRCALAACTTDSPNTGVVAGAGDNCRPASPTYTSPTVGFLAQDGGFINAIRGGLLTIGTTGASNSYGVEAAGAASRVSLSRPTAVSTTGADSYGLIATKGGTIQATAPLTITTTGQGAFGISTPTVGSSIAVSGATVSTSGVLGDAVRSDGGTVTLTGGAVTATGNGAEGLVALGPTARIVDTGGTVITVNGNTVNGPNANLPVDGAFAAQGRVDLTDAIIVATGTQNQGVRAQDGGTATVSGGSVTVSGADSNGLLATLNGAKINTSAGTVITSSATSSQFAIGGATALFTGVLNLTDTTVSTSGAGTSGILAEGGGIANLLGGSVTTTGNGGRGLFASDPGSRISTNGVAITTSGPGTFQPGAYAINGAALDLTNTTIAASGVGGVYGVRVDSAATASISGGSVSATGNNAIGVYAIGTGSTVGLSNDAAVTATGAEGSGVRADGGASIRLTGGTVLANGDGTPGIQVVGAGSSVTATGTAITTTGNVEANSFAPVGAFANGGALSLTNATVVTSGTQAHGVEASRVGGAGVGGTATLVGGLVTVSGANADGLVSVGPGSLITTSGGTSVTTTGTVLPNHVFNIQGARADFAGALSLTDTTISTSGVATSGVGVETSGTATLTRTKVTTSGADAHGLFATVVESQANLAAQIAQDQVQGFQLGVGTSISLRGANTIATGGNGAIGLFAQGGGAGGGTIDATGFTRIATGGTTSAAAGLSAFGVNADGAGARIDLADTTVTTSGAFATGVLASDRTASGSGGAVNIAGTATITTRGASAPGVEAIGTGSQVTLSGNTTINVTGAGSNALAAIDGGQITASGRLRVNMTDPGSVGVLVSGNNSSFSATGGTIATAGTALSLLDGVNQTVTLTGSNISNSAGDLIFVDPSQSVINLFNTTANAGNGNLLNVTDNSAVTLNASASTLTGAIRTDPTSTTNVNLTNGTVFNVTRNSNVTNLANIASTIIFAPPDNGGFKTFTTRNYTGRGGTIRLNTVLGPTGSPSDQLVIDRGTATGARPAGLAGAEPAALPGTAGARRAGNTRLRIVNAGGAGALTTGNGIPVIVAINGATTAPGSFQLANRVVAGGYAYSLVRAADQDFYLQSRRAATKADVRASLDGLADTRVRQIIANRILGSILLGANEQINCSNCASGFASVGSFAFGTHGRWNLSDRLTLLAGASLDQFETKGVEVDPSPIVAASLRYDLADWGRTRPFFELGSILSPYQPTRYSRSYLDGNSIGKGVGSSINQEASVFGRAGIVSRFTAIDEVAGYAEIARDWQRLDGYSEASNAFNAFPANIRGGIDSIDFIKLGAQYTHLFGSKIETNVSGGVVRGFGSHIGGGAVVDGFGAFPTLAAKSATFLEYGGRIGYRVTQTMIIDSFMIGTLGSQPAGNTIHGGLGVRVAF